MRLMPNWQRGLDTPVPVASATSGYGTLPSIMKTGPLVTNGAINGAA